MAERHRWFDYYLKGIDNGIGKEKQVYYYTQNAPKGREWQFSETWPLKNEQRVNYYFGAGRSGSVNSVKPAAWARRVTSRVEVRALRALERYSL